jgi:hypothetical protein
VIGKAIDDDLAGGDAGRGERLGRSPWIASGGLRLVDSARRRKETRERARRRSSKRAERRLGGLLAGDRRLAHDGDERQIGRPAQCAQVDVAELARQPEASSTQLAEPGAQSLEAGHIGHRFRP